MNRFSIFLLIIFLQPLQTTPLHIASVCDNPISEIISCLPNLSQHPLLYEPCKSRPCFLFVSQPPHVILSHSIMSQLPFQCANSQLHNISVDGTTFRIMNLTDVRNRLCIYSPHCSINQLIDWSYQIAQDGYQFVIANMLMDLPERRCHHSPTIGLYVDDLVIVSLKDRRFLKMILSACTAVSIYVTYVLLFMLSIFVLLYWRKRWDRTGLFPTPNDNESNHQSWNYSPLFLCILSFAILLFLELLLITRMKMNPTKSVSLSTIEVGKLAVPTGTGIEHIFKLRGKPKFYSFF